MMQPGMGMMQQPGGMAPMASGMTALGSMSMGPGQGSPGLPSMRKR